MYLFLENDAPTYYPGFGASLALVACCSLLNCGYAGLCYRENKMIARNQQVNDNSKAEDGKEAGQEIRKGFNMI